MPTFRIPTHAGDYTGSTAAVAPADTVRFNTTARTHIDLDHWGHRALALLDKPLLSKIQQAEATNDAPNRVIVKVKDPFVLEQLAAQYCGDCRPESIKPIGVGVLTLPQGTPVKEKIAEIGRLPGVTYAEHDDQVGAVALIPNDPDLGSQWGLGTIRATESWDVTTGRPQVTIAILDTGIDQDHPEFHDKIVANMNFTTSPTVDDMYFHGTHVAGVAAAYTDNAYGIAGMAPCATLMNVKVLDDYGYGQYSWIAQGITWAADHGAKVISMSLGGFGGSQAMEDAVDYAASKGAIIVAAAGNSSTDYPFYPANYDPVIAVAATDPLDNRAYFSNYGTWVDVAAPGQGIYSTVPNHASKISQRSFGTFSGTSMATPFVAGLAALLASKPSATSVRDRIQNTAKHVAGTGSLWTFGRIDAYAAVSAP